MGKEVSKEFMLRLAKESGLKLSTIKDLYDAGWFLHETVSQPKRKWFEKVD